MSGLRYVEELYDWVIDCEDGVVVFDLALGVDGEITRGVTVLDVNSLSHAGSDELVVLGVDTVVSSELIFLEIT